MASIHPNSSSLARPRPGRLAAVPEGSTDGAKADHPTVVGLYRDQIQAVDLSVVRRRSTIFGHGGSSSSSASNSCPSSNSGYSSGSASAVALECLGNPELQRIARQMIRDGYTWHMVQAFNGASPAPALISGGSPGHALDSWFSELDVDWVLQIDDEQGLRQLLRDKPATTQDLVNKWIRALTVIAANITELLLGFYTMPAVLLFGKASITELFDVVDVIITVLEAEKLRAVLDMFTCVCRELHILSICNEIGGPFKRQANRLSEVIASTIEEVRTHVEEDDSWAIDIPRGGGEVHNNTRFIMDCILSMMNAHTSTENSAPSHNSENLGALIDGTIDYLKGLLFTKSESCSDQSLRYLFLLNNSYFISHVVSGSSGSFIYKNIPSRLPPECKKYMDNYLDVSWGHMFSCMPKSRFPGPIHCWINTSSLAKFESAFHKTYQAQKFWKVPDPKLREALRRAITERVISGYRDYLEEHRELKKHVGRKSSSPEVLEEMLGQLFEG
ncbi:exocyst complex component EXO70A1-like [Triticum dicoccoides]|uniref:exocyst complex component EXO70A1-like n=1 Tax=Triticum dicoccoides TaxID=85692 RepID=UPI00188EE762|nr:exocyst complex component EXO70A1-like [Triticum dicoccoides]